MEQRDRLIELKKDLTDIFDEEYYRRNLITPQNTAEKLAEKGYRKTSDVAREILDEIDNLFYSLLYVGRDEMLTALRNQDTASFLVSRSGVTTLNVLCVLIAELKKKYTEGEH